MLLKARNVYAYGMQRDYFESPNCIGWTREGVDDNKASGCAVIISNGDAATLRMEIGKKHAGKTFSDTLQKSKTDVLIDADGFGIFTVGAGSVSVYASNKQR